MKRKAIALLSTFFLLGSTPALGAPIEDSFFKRFVKVESFLERGLSNAAPGEGDIVAVLGTKPNVNMIVSEQVKESATNRISLTPFTSVKKDSKMIPHLYYMIDDAPATRTLYSQVTVIDPRSREILAIDLDAVNTQSRGTAFVGIATLDEITFDRVGEYKIQFSMKVKNTDRYVRVGQTIIKVNPN
ncbi:hypothetical protein [Ammoniphilus sp. CFH 90114]|uniref:hypothetical protein n=1 Tax=Ammoniphilus sp. CFH 90114 TaxID=2493665 RepID=UPI00100F63AE|nr:hypothetical protein [Ammoniphilus sp. CFH 90114]RXT14968.1 hypothetical protein EIZ39_01800 [Ammoniphilus sp. CFH 90114]